MANKGQRNLKNRVYDGVVKLLQNLFSKSRLWFCAQKIQNIRAVQSFLLNLFLGKLYKITTIMPAQAIVFLLLL
jgi:hypothetical protein